LGLRQTAQWFYLRPSAFRSNQTSSHKFWPLTFIYPFFYVIAISFYSLPFPLAKPFQYIIAVLPRPLKFRKYNTGKWNKICILYL
jgi:hypothetical protein